MERSKLFSEDFTSAPQQFVNGEVHNWYRIILGYSDHLVARLLNRFGAKSGHAVLDPFCGTGTTIIECMKRGIDAVGIDANPSSVFAARVKLDWTMDSDVLTSALQDLLRSKHRYLSHKVAYMLDVTYQYMTQSGMVDRGWISPEPLRKALAIKAGIRELDMESRYKDALLLALIAEVVTTAANVKFGPELYCGPKKTDVDVYGGFSKRVKRMAEDLRTVKLINAGRGVVHQGDSRDMHGSLQVRALGPFDFVITSPPYPTEHDYTRNSRLELAFLEEVVGIESLRKIKRHMIRSHTKGIYKNDNDGVYVDDIQDVQEIAEQVEKAVEGKTHGFARLYPTVIRHYFGGMRRHLNSVRRYLRDGAVCAYMVGDQASYLRVPIPTSKIISEIAQREGFEEIETIHWRNRWSTTTAKPIGENILVLRNLAP